MELARVIAEVHNTFDERSMFIFVRLENSNSDACAMLKFQPTPKGFHVSPFSSRKGTYELEMLDPAATGIVDVKVTLWSSKGHRKLVARWWSADAAVDADTCGVWGGIWLLLGWAWLGLITCQCFNFRMAAG